MANQHSELISSGVKPTTITTTTAGSGNVTTLGDNDTQSSAATAAARWEYEEITLERQPWKPGLGFTVAGGVDNPHYLNDNSIYITKFIPNSTAALDGRLKLEDIIVKVDDIDLTDVTHLEAVTALQKSGNRVQLLIKRRKPNLINTIDNDNKIATTISKKQKQQTNNNNNNNYSNNHHKTTTRLFTSTLSSSNQLPPLLPRSTQSGPTLQRGTVQYSTTRESTSDRTQRLRPASSSLSLQQADENDAARGSHGGASNIENATTLGYSKSTSAIDYDIARNLSRQPRTVILQRTSKGLGFNIIGGLAGGGTYISYIVPGGSAERSNKLHCGDQILSVNGQDLRFATHKQAANTLTKAGQTVKLVVKYRPEEYIKLENIINDLREKNMLPTGTLLTSQKRSLYARALFDYDPSKDSGLPSKGLPFRFGDILHITNASDDEWWQARKVLQDGRDDIVHGIIPSKRRIEKRERARLKTVKFTNRNSSESTLDRRRKKFSFSKKFPFMKSRENLDGDEFDVMGGSFTTSRGVLSSSSTISVNNNNSERGSIRNETEDVILSYEPVLQQEINYTRPVALYGPVKEEIEGLREDLSLDERFFKMEQIVPHTTRPPKEGEVDGVKYHFVSMQQMKRDLALNKFVEAGELNHNLYGTSIESIREATMSGRHCLLNISPKAIKRLQDVSIFPVVIFIKPKSIESLLEMNKRWSYEEAAAAMEHANRIEQEFGNYFTSTIQMETPNQVFDEILKVVEQQSKPRIWIPTTFEALNVG